MSSLASLLVEKLVEFMERDYMEEEIRIEVIGSPPKVFIHEGFTELTRGAEYSVPRWLAEMLFRENTAKPREQEVSVENLSKIAYNEEALIKKLQLMKLPRYFYMMVREDIEKIREKLKSTADLSLLDEYKQLEDLYYTIGRIRVKKLLSFILLASVPQEIFEKLSEEERILFTLLREVLSTWMKNIGLEKP